MNKKCNHLSMASCKEPIFIIGYPKSGNTWLARLCADILDSPVVSGNDPVNQADKKQNCSGDFEIYKFHYSKHSKPDYITQSSKIIYVVRDLRDVLISGYFFNHQSHDENRIILTRKRNILNNVLRMYFDHQVHRMIKKWTSHELVVLRNFLKGNENLVGNWSDHVNYWIKFPNVCVINYEDLLEDAYSVMKLAFRNLGIHCFDQCLRESIERQSFNKRKKEFQEKRDEVNTKFMRKGVAGDWRRFLDEKTLLRIKRRHGDTMNLLGYEI